MSTSRKHYTDVERHLFLKILNKYKHIIENKKSDGATLKEKDQAWKEINEEYNSSLVISTKRTVKQLKKWWSNLKTDQRDALTKERQARMATGGGSPNPTADVDPEIVNIVPNLMTRAPTLFSSNIPKDEVEKRRNAVLDNEYLEEYLIESDDEIEKRRNADSDNEYLEEYLIEKSDDEIDDNNTSNLKSTSEPVMSNVKQCLKSTEKIHVTDIDYMPKRKFKKGNKQENSAEKELKLERIRRIIKHEEKLADVKFQHEIKKQKMEIEHLKEKNSSEIRASTASVALAELLLQEASNKYE